MCVLCLFNYERLEDNPHQCMFGTGPEITMFENIAPYVSNRLILLISSGCINQLVCFEGVSCRVCHSVYYRIQFKIAKLVPTFLHHMKDHLS